MKSFRAAGDRIVRQESALPSVVTRLLAPPSLARRSIGSEKDEWSIRLAALATLGQYDGLGVIIDGPPDLTHAYNLASDPADDPATRAAIDETRRSGATVQTHTAVRLADERVAASAMVAPLVAPGAATGVVVALRVGRSFAAADALTASGVSELLGLEVARDSAAERDTAHRRQAFALYELARLAIFGERLSETLEDVTALVISALDHDIAQVWLFAADGTLELRAASPHAGARSDRLDPSDHGAIVEALHHQRLVRIGHGALRPWVPDETRELIVAPLPGRSRSLGVLVLGRLRTRYDEADEELAGVLARFLARLIARAPAETDRETRAVMDAEAEREWVDEPELAGS